MDGVDTSRVDIEKADILNIGRVDTEKVNRADISRADVEEVKDSSIIVEDPSIEDNSRRPAAVEQLAVAR